jgi:hypothetical protein
MATLQETRDRADRMLLKIAPVIWRKQGEFLARHRRYWQGAWTHDTPPEDGVDTPADPLARVADERLSWAEMGIFTEPISTPFRMALHVYGEDDDAGYVIVAEALFNGNLYRRQYAVGARWEGYTYDWRVNNGID